MGFSILQLKEKIIYYADDAVLLERETTRFWHLIVCAKVFGLFSFQSASLGRWSGFVWWIINPVNVCKTFTTDFRAGNGSSRFSFTDKIISIKNKNGMCCLLCRSVMDERAILHSTSYN